MLTKGNSNIEYFKTEVILEILYFQKQLTFHRYSVIDTLFFRQLSSVWTYISKNPLSYVVWVKVARNEVAWDRDMEVRQQPLCSEVQCWSRCWKVFPICLWSSLLHVQLSLHTAWQTAVSPGPAPLWNHEAMVMESRQPEWAFAVPHQQPHLCSSFQILLKALTHSPTPGLVSDLLWGELHPLKSYTFKS